MSEKIHENSNPEPLPSADLDQLDYISIHSTATEKPLNKNTIIACAEESNSRNNMHRESKDIYNAESTGLNENRTYQEELPVKLAKLNVGLSPNVFQNEPYLSEDNELKNLQEKFDDSDKQGTIESNTEETIKVKTEPLHRHTLNQIYTDESNENKETDQLYLLSNVLQNESNEENIEYAACDFWDFAGQKDFYATHQTFLSINAIYLLTIDLSSFATDPPVQEEGGKLDHIGGK